MHKKVQDISKELKEVKRVTMCNTIMMAVFVIWTIAKPYTGAVTNTATGGAVTSTIAVNVDPEEDNRNEVIERAVHRGYYTASEFAIFEGVDKRTIYRRLDSGVITNAQKVDGHWRIFCN